MRYRNETHGTLLNYKKKTCLGNEWVTSLGKHRIVCFKFENNYFIRKKKTTIRHKTRIMIFCVIQF